jgi:hypothetical protein
MLLKQVFKTYEGALKRVRFENAIARDQHRMGRGMLYNFTLVKVDGGYRINREISK